MDNANALKVCSELTVFVLHVHLGKNTIKFLISVWIFAVQMKFFQMECVFAHQASLESTVFAVHVPKKPSTINPY